MGTDDRDANHAKNDATLCAITRGVAFGAFVGASGELMRLGLTSGPIEESVDRIAAIAAAAVVERTRSAQPFDPNQIGLVVTGLTAAFLEIYIGTLRSVTAFERQRLGLAGS